MNDLFLESSDEAYRVLDLFLRVGAERPVTEAEPAAHEINRRIEREQESVANVAREREPLYVLHHGVELVPVNNEHPASVRQTMNGVLLQGDITIGAIKFGEQIVVIPRNVNDACALARLAQDFLHDVVVLLRPVNSAPQLPDVDQVAHHIERFEFVLPQEIEQRARVRAVRAQMHIRDPRRPHPTD